MVSRSRQNYRNRLLVGGAVVVLSMIILYVSMLGPSGGLFVTPLITYPMSILGGIIIGYSVVALEFASKRRTTRVTFALGAALLAFTGQLVIFAVMNPGIDIAVDWPALSRNWYPLVLAITGIVIGSIELGVFLNSRLDLYP